MSDNGIIVYDDKLARIVLTAIHLGLFDDVTIEDCWWSRDQDNFHPTWEFERKDELVQFMRRYYVNKGYFPYDKLFVRG